MVECPACHTSNPPESRLCSKCSAPFGIDSATLVDRRFACARSSIRTSLKFSTKSHLRQRLGGTGWSVPLQRSGASNPSAPVEAGMILGERYEILKRLGEGGMGAVYKARDHELDRLVALKVIRPELAGHPDILRRFKQELILARQVTHKNVVRIFDLGSADGRKFITMDYIEGRDLKSILVERGKLPAVEVVPIFQQICRGLEAAHVEGVVHRDLKPQNIMLDAAGRVWLMDFGLGALHGDVGTDAHWRADGHAGLHVPRAGPRRESGRSLGLVQPGHHRLRNADWAIAVPGRYTDGQAAAAGAAEGHAGNRDRSQHSRPLGAVVAKCLEPRCHQAVSDHSRDSGRSVWRPASTASSSSQVVGLQSDCQQCSAEASRISLAELGPGSQFGPRYRIESEIGEGGMGKVYKAHDSDLDRTVALKLVRPELARDASSLQRFKQELLLASRISHRNILRIHDLGDVGGVKFISMAYVQGMDLHDLIAKTGKLQTERVVNIAKQLAGALEAAHAEGVVHRDLKPRNVLITVDDHVYVSDFGLAKSLDAETTGHDPRGRSVGHAPLHVARAGRIESRRPSQRSLLAGRDSV